MRNFVYVHPLLLADAEGQEMFRATTLDLNNLVLDESGKVDHSMTSLVKKLTLQ